MKHRKKELVITVAFNSYDSSNSTFYFPDIDKVHKHLKCKRIISVEQEVDIYIKYRYKSMGDYNLNFSKDIRKTKKDLKVLMEDLCQQI